LRESLEMGLEDDGAEISRKEDFMCAAVTVRLV
jgi:hypothetical protein